MSGIKEEPVPEENDKYIPLRSYIDLIGRVAYITQHEDIPNPWDEKTEMKYNQWVDGIVSNFPIPADETVSGVEGLLTWSWGDLWNIVSALPNDVAKVGKDVSGLVNLFDPANGLDALASRIGGIVKGGILDISKSPVMLDNFVKVGFLNTLSILKEIKNNDEKQVEILINYFCTPEIKKEFKENVQKLIKDAESSFEFLINHIQLIRDLESKAFGYADRFIAVANSIYVLARLFSPQAKVLNDMFNIMCSMLFAKDRQGNKTTAEVEEDLAELMALLIIEASPILSMIYLLLSKQNNKSLLGQLFPFGLKPGDLSDFLNVANAFPAASDATKDDEILFRGELIAALDQYLRTETPAYGKLMRGTDQRNSVDLLVDLSNVVCSLIFGYVFRSPGLPSPTLPKMTFANKFTSLRADDIGYDVAATVSRTLVDPMRSVLGIALNGVWAVSPNNEQLVEAVSGFAGHLARGLIEYLLADLFWAFELHEIYAEDAADAIDSWDAPSPGTGAPALKYALFQRPGVLAELDKQIIKDLLDESKILKNLLKDYAAYREAVREFRPLANAATPDSVEAKLKADNTTTTITATSDWSKLLNIPSRPVLRAYANGEAVILKPGAKQTHTQEYSATITGKQPVTSVFVTSNYGGSFAAQMDSNL